ncbi:hypothetical protein PLICRDRAFT_251052 [Plicaturopsis crispa FD-325 SS-3]|nr:hypothetical protein PLICRDRAFT_251052 [Plicaturopsis crispa FD-325 SS-3]
MHGPFKILEAVAKHDQASLSICATRYARRVLLPRSTTQPAQGPSRTPRLAKLLRTATWKADKVKRSPRSPRRYHSRGRPQEDHPRAQLNRRRHARPPRHRRQVTRVREHPGARDEEAVRGASQVRERADGVSWCGGGGIGVRRGCVFLRAR